MRTRSSRPPIAKGTCPADRPAASRKSPQSLAVKRIGALLQIRTMAPVAIWVSMKLAVSVPVIVRPVFLPTTFSSNVRARPVVVSGIGGYAKVFRNAPFGLIPQVLSGLLELSNHLGRLRDGLLPLRGDIRELAELRDPVERQVISPAAERWLRSIETDLAQDVPAVLSVADARIAGALLQLQGERSEATNRVVLLLTIITVAFFVPTLLTGLYGMNVPLPRQRHDWIFWSVVGLAAALLGVAAAAITRLGLWGTFRSVLPGPGLSLRPDLTVIPKHPPVDTGDIG